jgi:peptidoglycan/LPS O-acetylase OafA/YrhL
MTRNNNLDGLRGLAALSVVLGHCATYYGGVPIYLKEAADFHKMTGPEIFIRLWHTVFNADAAVMLFFVLSGYVLGKSMLRRSEGPIQAFLPFVFRRATRLYPVAIAAAALLWVALPRVTLPEAISAATLMDRSVNGVIWSLQVELVGSLVIYALWATRSRMLVSSLVIGFAYLYYAVPAWVHPMTFGLFESMFLMFQAAFVCGYAIASGVARIPRSKLLLLAGVVAYLGSDLFLGREWGSRFMEIAGATVIVGYFANAPIAALDSRPVQFLGAVSYPMYIVQIVMVAYGAKFVEFVAQKANPLPKVLLLAAAVVPLSLVMGWLMTVTVERPAMRLPALLSSKRSAPASITEVA